MKYNVKTKLCSVSGCSRKHRGLGYCEMHYYRYRRGTDMDKRVEIHEEHGLFGSPEYNSWRSMIQRCCNPNYKQYQHWGGRGVTVCEEWRLFSNFYKDMGLKPSAGHSIDRIDNDGDYKPSNCRWATLSEQNLNRRISSRNTSGYTGVMWNKRRRKWEARYRRVSLGFFTSKDSAIATRQEAENAK